MEPQGYLLFAISIPNIVLGNFILLRKIKDPINIFFSAFAFSTGLWSFGLAAYIFTDGKNAALGWAQFYYSAAAIIATSFLLFALSFTGRWNKLTKEEMALTMIPLVVMVGAIWLFPSFLLNGLEYREWGKEVILDRTGYLIYTIYFTLYVGTGFVLLVRQILRSSGQEKIYLRFVITGLTIAFALGAMFNLFYPFFGNYKYIWVGPLFTLVYISLISYAIVKHRLFDIRLIVARSLGYILSIFFIGVTFGLIVFGVVDRVVAEGVLSQRTQEVLFTLIAVLIAFAFQPLKTFFDRVTNRLFYRDAYIPQVFLDELNQVLVSTIELDRLLVRSANIIQKHIKSEYCLFGLKETQEVGQRIIGTVQKRISKSDIDFARHTTPNFHQKVIVADLLEADSKELQKKMQKNDISVLVRLVENVEGTNEGIGYIVMGAKKSGNPYNAQDTKMLEIVANSLVIAIDNALRFEEIQKFNITLEKKVEDATRRLQRANDKLVALDQTKDDFISMASHQLRTPLTSVKGYLSMVLEGDAGKVNPKQAKLLDQAFISSQRMVYLIADLLNVSRLRTGKFVIDSSAVDLAEIVEGEVSQLQETAEARQLKLRYERPKNFPQLMLDETKIRQVVMNFIDNAIYYTPAGGEIVVRLKQTGDTVEYTVQDTGIGVPRSEQHNLFSKFFRAGNARKARPDGTGLGLFMAKKVIVAQGGAVVFRSAEGKGSTFGFTFSKAKLAPEGE